MKFANKQAVFKLAGATAMVLLALSAQAASSRTEAGSRAQRSDYSTVLTPGARRSIEGVQDVTRHLARSDAERAVRESTGGHYSITSRDRPGSSQIHSRAHDRGAIDVRTANTGTQREYTQARDISQHLGPHYNVVVERPVRNGQGASYDRHTTFNNGVEGRTRDVAPRATAPHTHVQPNYGIDVPWRAGTFGGRGAR